MPQSSVSPRWLDDSIASPLAVLTAPLTPAQFAKLYWGAQFVHLPGSSGRFTHLFSWTCLSHVLESQRLGFPRLRLCKNGRTINARQYQKELVFPTNGPIVLADQLLDLLRGGATLIIDEVEDTHEPLRQFVMSLQHLFAIHIYVNLYAAWGDTNGFPAHWDPHDTFIIQVAGRKQWSVWAPTREHPVQSDRTSPEVPTVQPVWTGQMCEGDVLYLPRGWWHIAYPVNEPTLHLTLTLNNKTGVHFLAWLTKELLVETSIRKDIPLLDDRSRQLAYVDDLKRLLIDRVTVDAFDAFLASAKRECMSRPAFGFPQLDPPDDGSQHAAPASRAVSTQFARAR